MVSMALAQRPHCGPPRCRGGSKWARVFALGTRVVFDNSVSEAEGVALLKVYALVVLAPSVVTVSWSGTPPRLVHSVPPLMRCRV